MDNELQKIADACIKAAILASMAAAIRALLVVDKNFRHIVKTFIAGILFGVCIAWIMVDSRLGNMWKDIIIAVCGAFASTVFPLVEKLVLKYITKKGEKVV